MGVYTSDAPATPADAQRMVDAHPVSSGDGRCQECAVVGPCVARVVALSVLAQHRQLPRRRAGATRPELIGLRRVRLG
jgi:hypothetical protein